MGSRVNTWLNEKNADVPEITKAGSFFIELCSKTQKNETALRFVRQAARELLLSESSDWSFILRAGTTTKLAKERIERHLSRFWKLVNMVNQISELDIKYLEILEEEDKIFPDIQIEDWKN